MSYNHKIASTSDVGVFKADGTTTTVTAGVFKPASSSSGKTWTQISTNTIASGSSSITISSISNTYKELYYTWESVAPSAAITTVQLEFSTDNFTTSINSGWQSNRQCGYGNTTQLGFAGSATSNLRQGFLVIDNSLPFAFKPIYGAYNCRANAAASFQFGPIAGMLETTNPINAIRFSLVGATMSSGLIRLYGANSL